jgi:1,4-dihydroxy-2-naphthoate octaprenyltransferase
LTVAVEWWLVVVGADYVQRGHLMVSPMFTGVGYALLVANILLVNGLPDAKSDASVGKHTLATRLGHSGVALLYAGVVLVANLWLALGVWMQISPLNGLWALVALPLSGSAAWILVKAKPDSTHLKVPIVLTIVAANTHGLALAVGLALPRL